MTLWNRLRIFSIFLRLVRNPNRTDLIFKGVRIVSGDPNQAPLKAVEQTVMANEDFRNQYESGYIPTNPNLDTLKSLPEGTFGQAVFQHMNSNGLSFEIFPKLQPHQPIEYLSQRIYQDHDLWHVLLGCGIEVEDELCVQAFGVAQFGSPIGTLIIAGGLLHLLSKNPTRAVKALGRISDTYATGRRARFLLSAKLHEDFALPLLEVQSRYGLSAAMSLTH